jgi:Arc/MetJ family transcription regulator
MKRTNLVLDEDLLNKASRLLGEKTYSATVNKALEEAIKVTSLRNLLNFQGSDIWEGDLKEMREDKGYKKK